LVFLPDGREAQAVGIPSEILRDEWGSDATPDALKHSHGLGAPESD